MLNVFCLLPKSWWWLTILLPVLMMPPASADEIGATEALGTQPDRYYAQADNQRFTVQWRPLAAPVINELQHWQLLIGVKPGDHRGAAQLAALTPDKVMISGGMPAHAHGLPTDPRVLTLKAVSPYQVLVEVGGLKFQMWGQWFLRVAIPALEGQADVHFSLAP